MKHTQGDWSFVKKRGHVQSSEAKRIVAFIAHGDAESLANGELIAAAPELLEGCEQVTRREFWTTHEDDCGCVQCKAYLAFIGSDAVNKIVAAIRKAKGE